MSSNGASPQPDEVYLPGPDGCGGLSGGLRPCGVAGGVYRLRSRVAPGRLAVPVMSRVVRWVPPKGAWTLTTGAW
jgi:hypothetical protein